MRDSGETAPASAKLVRARGLVKRYGATMVLHGVDLEIAERSFTTPLGPSGCGKTTILRSWAGSRHRMREASC